MVVYADVLIFLNLIINYFLLLAVSKALHKRILGYRIILSALVGALSSLYIFLPPLNIFVEFGLKTSICIIMCFIAFGFGSLYSFLKSTFMLFVITLGYGGFMYAVWLVFKPNGMVINNSVVYFDISLVALVVFTALGYIIFSLIFKFFSRTTPFAEDCRAIVYANGKSVELNAIIDTGNSIEDVFSLGDVIICNKNVAVMLFDTENLSQSGKLKSRYRLLPCSTVSGADILEGIRCDKAIIKYNHKNIILKKPILAFSKIKLQENNAIINPKILG